MRSLSLRLDKLLRSLIDRQQASHDEAPRAQAPETTSSVPPSPGLPPINPKVPEALQGTWQWIVGGLGKYVNKDLVRLARRYRQKDGLDCFRQDAIQTYRQCGPIQWYHLLIATAIPPVGFVWGITNLTLQHRNSGLLMVLASSIILFVRMR